MAILIFVLNHSVYNTKSLNLEIINETFAILPILHDGVPLSLKLRLCTRIDSYRQLHVILISFLAKDNII